MKLLIILGLLSTAGACSQPPPTATPRAGELSPLGHLMKDQVNPTFSRLILLVFHSESLDAEPATLRAELQRAAATLQNAASRLREWNSPPTQSPEGRQVFYTYANSVERASQRLVAAIDRDDDAQAAAQLEQIADTCNSCHHFFRLRLKDSVVPSR